MNTPANRDELAAKISAAVWLFAAKAERGTETGTMADVIRDHLAPTLDELARLRAEYVHQNCLLDAQEGREQAERDRDGWAKRAEAAETALHTAREALGKIAKVDARVVAPAHLHSYISLMVATANEALAALPATEDTKP